MVNKNKKGLWILDPFLNYIKGYSGLEEATRDGMTGLYIEVDRIRNALFPLREKPVKDHPGYVTHEQDYFLISHSDPGIKSDLEKYFLDEHHVFNRGLYGSGHNLGGLFEMACYGILVNGRSFYKIDWEKVDVGENKYILPVDFRYLSTPTMKTRGGEENIKGYRQRYSLVSYLFESRFKQYNGTKLQRKFEFDKDEILFFKYPFDNKSPVQRAVKYLPTIKKFWEFGLNQSRSSVEVENHSLSIERTRYTTYKTEKRRYDLTKCKIRTIFNYLFDVDKDLRITEYYDVYTVTRYKRYLNNLRDYFVKEFNKQILSEVAKKNNFSTKPILKIDGLLTNAEIDKVFQRFIKREIKLDDFIEGVVKRD